MSGKKRILYIVEAMGGGVFSYIVDLANELVNTYDIYIAYAIRPQTPQNYKAYFDAGIHLIEVKNFTRSIGLVKDVKALFEIRYIAKKVKPHIIHLHSSKAGVLGRWAFSGHKVPIFYTPHGYSFLMADCNAIKRSLYNLIERISAKRFCTTISCSKGEHKETLKITKRAVYVNNGINQFTLDKLLSTVKVKEHPVTVFTLGRICYQKNPKLFNDIAKRLPDIHFLWIGDGELRYLLTAPNIEITGWTNRNLALEKSMNADIFLLTSSWEGLPISLLEAMYMKKACVVSDVIGNHDVIHDGENGFVCESIPEFVNSIKKCRDLDVASQITRAHTDVLTQYNIKSMAESYSNIYRKAFEEGIY